jgi:hypothetical protein
VALFRINLGLGASALWLPAALIAGGAVLGVQILRRRGLLPTSIDIPVLTLVAAYGVVIVVGLPILEGSRPTAPLGRWIAENSPAGSTVGIYRVNDWRASLRYYTGRRVVTLANRGELSEFFAQYPDGYVVMLQHDARHLSESGMDVREAVGRPAIVGRTGRYLRKQVWGRLVVVTRPIPRRLPGPTA